MVSSEQLFSQTDACRIRAIEDRIHKHFKDPSERGRMIELFTEIPCAEYTRLLMASDAAFEDVLLAGGLSCFLASPIATDYFTDTCAVRAHMCVL